MLLEANIHRTSQSLKVIVTCSNRKSLPVPESLHLRNTFGSRVGTRIKHWTNELSDASALRIPARSLYAGEHWVVARAFEDGTLPFSSIELWVCSAGYGLVKSDSLLRPYSATFTQSHPDSVPGGRIGAAVWWERLSNWSGPDGGSRSLDDLFNADRKSIILMILSPPYLQACKPDLLNAINRLDEADQLSIISAGTKNDNDLGQFILPVNSRLQESMGGSLRSLNVRVGRHLLLAGAKGQDEMRLGLVELNAGQCAIQREKRSAATDDEICDFVAAHLGRNGLTTRTRLLRMLREAGIACGQERFADIVDANVGLFQ
jgi:hypothetical protein